MKKDRGIKIVLDTGVIISLIVINKLDILDKLFSSVNIPYAVWEEVTNIKNDIIREKAIIELQNKVKKINNKNILKPFIDYGESEAIILTQEIKADYLVIDDKKARIIAESIGVQCIGTLGILYKAKEKGIIKELRKLFLKLISNNRYYSKQVLNKLLEKSGERKI